MRTMEIEVDDEVTMWRRFEERYYVGMRKMMMMMIMEGGVVSRCTVLPEVLGRLPLHAQGL